MYVHLLPVFHKNNAAWDELYRSLYNSPASYHLDISLQQSVGAKQSPAFFCYNDELFFIISDMMANLKELQNITHDIPSVAVDHFMRSCLIEEIKSSNEIEGVRSTRKEIKEAMDSQNDAKSSGTVRLWSIVNKYKKLQNLDDIPFNTCQDLRDFYDSFLLDEVSRSEPGNAPDGAIFSAGPVDVWNQSKVIHQGVYPEEAIIRLMNGPLAILRSEQIPALLRVAVFHYLFGYIHPFYDGNGRMSRFITSYYLARILDPLVALRLSITIKKSLRTYYKLFTETNAFGNRGDLTPFINGFLWLVLKSMTRVKEILAAKNRQLLQLTDKLADIANLSDKNYKLCRILLQADLFSEDGATLAEIAQATGGRERTVRERIQSLPQGWVKNNTTQRAYRYRLNTQFVLGTP